MNRLSQSFFFPQNCLCVIFFQQRRQGSFFSAAGRRPGRWLWKRPGLHPEKVGVQMGVGVAYKLVGVVEKSGQESWKIISPKDFRHENLPLKKRTFSLLLGEDVHVVSGVMALTL